MTRPKANQNQEQKARHLNVRQLVMVGWLAQGKKGVNASEGLGVAIQKYQGGIGPIDYVLLVDKQAIGITDIKPANWGKLAPQALSNEPASVWLERIPAKRAIWSSCKPGVHKCSYSRATKSA